MNRYSSGVYTILNRNGYEIEYTLDNQNYRQPQDSLLTIYVSNILLVDSAYGATVFVSKIANSKESVIGNTAYSPV